MDPALLAKGFTLGFAIAAAVGPISLLVIRRTLAEGRVVGLASGLGVATADATYGAIAAFGLTAITDVLVDGGRALGLIGGIFLLWLAWKTARAEPGTAATVTERRGGLAGAYLSILGLTLTNPMTILSFGALFAGSRRDRARTLRESALITLGVFLGSAAWWVVLTTAVGALRSRLTPRWMRAINVASGLVIGAFAVVAIAVALGAVPAPYDARLVESSPQIRDRRSITVRRGGTLQDDDHRLLAMWAADCAEHVLHHFEQARPKDDRPRRRSTSGVPGRGVRSVGRGPHGGRPCQRRGQGPERGGTACRVRRRPGRGGGSRRGPRARCRGLRGQGGASGSARRRGRGGRPPGVPVAARPAPRRDSGARAR